MRRSLAALAAGVVFGLGLSLSQMVDPGKVVAFLDLAGRWDPSLAFVMGGALAVTAVGYRLALRRERPLLEPQFAMPSARDLDAPLLGGAALFGVGWGLSGFCPGPALASLAYGIPDAALFVLAMAAGMALHGWRPALRTAGEARVRATDG